jgi:heme-degrading monooxygenase HmoA
MPQEVSEMTFTRMTTLQADPSKLEEGIRFFREQSVATARQQRGFQGARLLVNRQSGKVMAVTLWESEEAARAAESAMNQSRTQGAQLVGATNPTTEVMEMVVNESA